MGCPPEADAGPEPEERALAAGPSAAPAAERPAAPTTKSALEGGTQQPPSQPAKRASGEAAQDAVTVARIDAFLRYQERRLTLEASLWKELEAAMPKTRRRAGTQVPPSRASLELLERRASEDEAALAEVGLTRAELSELGSLVRDVLGPRRLARELALEETAALLEEQAERLEGAQAAELQAQAAPLRARLNELLALEQVRLERGDAAVDAVLAREESLLTWEQARFAALAGL